MNIRQNILIAIFVFSLSAVGAFAQTEAQMEKDAEKVHDLYKKVNGIKDFRLPEGVWSRIGENYPRVQKSLDGISRTREFRKEKSAFLNEFAGKYASGAKDYQIPRALNKKFESLSLGFSVGDEYQSIMFRFGILDGAGEKNAYIVLKHIRDFIESPRRLKGLHEIYRVKAIEEFKNLLAILPLYDDGNTRIVRRVGRLQTDVAQALKEYRAEEIKVLSSRRWKANISSTSAGSPVSIAAAGKRFMTNRSDWGGNTKKQTKIRKVAIRGDWFVAERSFGRPTRYGIRAAVAVSDNTMDAGVVTVYEVSLITKEAKKNTNFYGVWVGKVWRILDKNLPK